MLQKLNHIHKYNICKFILAFDTLNVAAKKFFLEGSKWKMPFAFMTKLRAGNDINTYGEWENWMLQKQDQKDDFWAVHEGWLRIGQIPQRISVTNRTKMIGFMLTFLEYEQVKKNQPKVIFFNAYNGSKRKNNNLLFFRFENGLTIVHSPMANQQPRIWMRSNPGRLS